MLERKCVTSLGKSRINSTKHPRPQDKTMISSWFSQAMLDFYNLERSTTELFVETLKLYSNWN